jgi:hypothetical protein
VEKGLEWWWLLVVKTATLLFDDGVAGVVGAGVGVVAAAAVGLALPLLVERGEDAEARRGFLLAAASPDPDVGVDGTDDVADDDDDARFVLRQPPPTGTLRRTPPLVQYRRQLLQKCRGCDRL